MLQPMNHVSILFQASSSSSSSSSSHKASLSSLIDEKVEGTGAAKKKKKATAKAKKTAAKKKTKGKTVTVKSENASTKKNAAPKRVRGVNVDNRNNHNNVERQGLPHPNQQQQQQGHKKNSKSNNNWQNMPPNRKLNQKIVQCGTAQQVLQVVASQKGALSSIGGGGNFNSVNFSTTLHRLAKHLQYNNFDNNSKDGTTQNFQNQAATNRAKLVADPRFALFLCCAAEAIVSTPGNQLRDLSNKIVYFNPREMSNIAWALAKYQIVPPQSVIPVDLSYKSVTKLQGQCEQVRKLVYQVAKERTGGNGGTSTKWVPAVSQLCCHLIDYISFRVLSVDPTKFRIQEWANMLWALATMQRANETIYSFIIQSLMTAMSPQDDNNKETNNNGDNGREEVLRPQEWANSIWALATSGVVGPEEELLPFVADLMDEHQEEFLDQFKPQELSNAAWGVATILGKRSNTNNAEDRLLDGPTSYAALRIFRHVARQLIRRQGEGFKSQELANSIWAFATLGFGLPSSAGAVYLTDNRVSDYTFLKSDDEEGDQELMEEAVRAVLDAARRMELRRFRSQELNNLAWTMTRLDQKDDEFSRLIGMELANPKRPVSAQDIGTSLWSLASIEFFDDELYRAIAYRITPDRAQRSKPQEMSNLLWALATAEVAPKFIDVFDSTLVSPKKRPSVAKAQTDPVTRCFGLAAQELMRRPQEFKTQEIKDILWAFSRVGVRHPTLFRTIAEYLVGSGDHMEFTGRGLDDFSPQGLGNLAWAYARQAQLGAETLGRHDSKGALIASTSGRLAHYTTIFIDIGESLLQKLFIGIAEADIRVHNNLQRLKPQDLTNTAWAFAILGMKHTRFLGAVVTQLLERTRAFVSGKRNSSNRFTGQEIANALWALATLNYVPKEVGLVSEIEPYLLEMASVKKGSGEVSVKSIAKSLKRQEMANIAWICAVFGEYPPDLVKVLYQGLIGFGEKTDPLYINSVHNDGGIQQSAVMSLMYLQIAMDLDLGESNKFYLPDGFPEEWEPGKVGDGYNLVVDDDTGIFDLQLTSSKIQSSVSNAFSRIGFQHVEEHVISKEELACRYGVQVSPTGQEILSLDIADVDSKIGVEVDGPAHFVTTIDDGNTAAGHLIRINGKMEYQFEWGWEKQEINGPTALKLRLLKQLGWHVFNIPFWEWYTMDGDSTEEEEYCRSLLNE